MMPIKQGFTLRNKFVHILDNNVNLNAEVLFDLDFNKTRTFIKKIPKNLYYASL